MNITSGWRWVWVVHSLPIYNIQCNWCDDWVVPSLWHWNNCWETWYTFSGNSGWS